jgi:hypothetical protein
MARAVGDDHFATGVWAADGPIRLRVHTCVVCGNRTPTWEAFRAHRRVCAARPGALAPADLPPDGTEPAVDADPVSLRPAG